MISLAKSLDHSSSAAKRDGPKALSPAWLKSSTIPAARASSGPIKDQAISFSLANSISLECSEIPMFTKSNPSKVMPSFPGATKTCSTSLDSNNFLAIACSRPPEPTTKSFIAKIPQYQISQALTHQANTPRKNYCHFYELFI